MTASFGKDQVLVGLLGIGLLRVFADDDAAVENGSSPAVENAFVHLVARAVRLGVVEHGVIVDMLRAVHDVEAVERGFRAFGKHRVGVVAHQGAAQRDGVRGEVGAASKRGLQRGDVKASSDSCWIL